MNKVLILTTQKIFLQGNLDYFNTEYLPVQQGVVGFKIGLGFKLVILDMTGNLVKIAIKNEMLGFDTKIILKLNGKIYKYSLKTDDFALKFSLKYKTEKEC